SDLSVTLGSTTAFNGSASRDPDGTISSYQWSFGDGYTSSGVSVSHTYTGLGLYTVTLTVTDNLGATASDTALVTVLALADTTPPTVSLTTPASGSTLSSMVTLSANASDNVGVARVEYYCDTTIALGTNSIAPY